MQSCGHRAELSLLRTICSYSLIRRYLGLVLHPGQAQSSTDIMDVYKASLVLLLYYTYRIYVAITNVILGLDHRTFIFWSKYCEFHVSFQTADKWMILLYHMWKWSSNSQYLLQKLKVKMTYRCPKTNEKRDADVCVITILHGQLFEVNSVYFTLVFMLEVNQWFFCLRPEGNLKIPSN